MNPLQPEIPALQLYRLCRHGRHCRPLSFLCSSSRTAAVVVAVAAVLLLKGGYSSVFVGVSLLISVLWSVSGVGRVETCRGTTRLHASTTMMPNRLGTMHTLWSRSGVVYRGTMSATTSCTVTPRRFVVVHSIPALSLLLGLVDAHTTASLRMTTTSQAHNEWFRRRRSTFATAPSLLRSSWCTRKGPVLLPMHGHYGRTVATTTTTTCSTAQSVLWSFLGNAEPLRRPQQRYSSWKRQPPVWSKNRTATAPLSTKTGIGTTATSAVATTWSVGDVVVVHPDAGTSTILGHIVEIKRGGWFTIQTTAGNNCPDGTTTIKCRAKNLFRPHAYPSASTLVSPVDAASVPSYRHDTHQAAPGSNVDALATTTVPVVGQHYTQSAAVADTALVPTTVPMTTTANVAAAVAPVFPHVTTSQDAPELPIVAPPPPTMIDLDELLRSAQGALSSLPPEYIHQLEHFATFRQWVVFTDLHCSSATLDTCRQVLEIVHAQAVQRNAGILFLGDFWHVRGSLRVDLLNAILLDSLAHWTQPCIMIPGNHDQVTAALTDNHSLTPLQHAYRVRVPPFAATKDAIGIARPDTLPGILIFSQPTVFCQALWIPHVRSPAVLESILQSPLSQNNATTKAIFCHVDLTGGYMNDNIVSNGGVSPRVFPPNIPVYTGHFHKPHVIARTTYDEVTGDRHDRRIEYLGSPYQVSLAEAQQSKALAVLEYAPSVDDNNTTWSCVDRIPISVGRQHFRPSTMADFLALKIADNGTDTAIYDSLSVSETDSFQVKPGDRVVFFVEKQELADLRRTNTTKFDSGTSATSGPVMNPLDEHVALLRKAGVLVEIREKALDWSDRPTVSTSATGSARVPVEDLSPPSLWDAFLNDQVERGTMLESARATLQSAGIVLIEEIERGTSANDTAMERGDDNGTNSEAVSSVVSAPFTKSKPTTDNGFQLHSLSLQGFGPFRDPITYPLLDRGLVLIRGSNRDGGSDRCVRNVDSRSRLVNWIRLTHFSMLQAMEQEKLH
jgi:Calcineurin-like phosphoesterase